jgi:hypothetical protein
VGHIADFPTAHLIRRVPFDPLSHLIGQAGPRVAGRRLCRQHSRTGVTSLWRKGQRLKDWNPGESAERSGGAGESVDGGHSGAKVWLTDTVKTAPPTIFERGGWPGMLPLVPTAATGVQADI